MTPEAIIAIVTLIVSLPLMVLGIYKFYRQRRAQLGTDNMQPVPHYNGTGYPGDLPRHGQQAIPINLNPGIGLSFTFRVEGGVNPTTGNAHQVYEGFNGNIHYPYQAVCQNFSGYPAPIYLQPYGGRRRVFRRYSITPDHGVQSGPLER
ncbi:hypothetical protein TWF730_003165 [Orbilia blumenaviensis]|uniref:Uncharacterized protein n=1 Tax=Orbilia blumenaviensis TaxID=1796055 RepID=A0AAV9U8I7_9PEZI